MCLLGSGMMLCKFRQLFSALFATPMRFGIVYTVLVPIYNLFCQFNDSVVTVPGPQIGFTVRYPKDNTDPRIFQTLTYNSEQGFNMATGKFVCQHPGMYLFTATIIREEGIGVAYCNIRVNAENRIQVIANNVNSPSSGYPSGSATLVVHLSAGDEVFLSHCSGTHIFSDSSFSGVLIQPDVN